MPICFNVSAQIKYIYDVSGNRILSEQDSTYPSKPLISSINDSTLTSSPANYYKWFFNNDTLSNQTNKSLSIHNPGFYKVGISPNKQCWAYSNDYPVVVISTPLPDTLSMLIYPNPSSGEFTVDVKLEKTTGVETYITVYNELGSQILQTNKLIFFTNEIKIPITILTNGTYNVQLSINRNFKTQQVLIIKY